MADSILLIFLSIVSFCAGALFYERWRARAKSVSKHELHVPSRTGFLFEGNTLVDATPVGRQLLEGLGPHHSDRTNLLMLCSEQYPDLEEAWDDLPNIGSKVLKDVSTGACDLEIANVGERVSIRLLDGPEIRGQTIQEDLFASRVKFLSEIINTLPSLVWKQHENGELLWSNRQYKEALVKLGKVPSIDDPGLEKAQVFPDLEMPEPKPQTPFGSVQSYQSDGEDHWFNVTCFPATDGDLHIAIDANEAMQARQSQASSLRTFVQIFAQLSIGFAIFDENRQLTIYNPSIVELTGLDPVFLTAKPTLLRVVEEMRRKDKTPEPKNFEDLRETIRKIQQAAEGDTYESVWTLVDGQSLRVTARPYQTGSIALLIEDVSSELALTRKYRTEVNAYQELFEQVETPTFLFSANGILLINNERATTKELGPLPGISNISDLLAFLNAKTIAGKTLQNKDIPLARLTALTLPFLDGRSFQLSCRTLNGGLHCIELTHKKPAMLETPKVLERTAR